MGRRQGWPGCSERVAGWRERQEAAPCRYKQPRKATFGNDSRNRSAVTSGTRMARPLVPSGPGRPAGRPGRPTIVHLFTWAVPDNGCTGPHPAIGVAHGSFGKGGENAKVREINCNGKSSRNG